MEWWHTRKQLQEVITAWAHLLFATNLLAHVLNCVPVLQRAQQPTKLFKLLVTEHIYIFCILWCSTLVLRRQAISSYESIQPCALPKSTVLSVLCQVITTTRFSSTQKSRLITQIPRIVHLYHHGKIWVNTYMCLHVTFKNLAVPEKFSNTSIQQPIKGFNIWCYACRRRTFHYNGFIKYIMHRTFLCSRWRRCIIETKEIAVTSFLIYEISEKGCIIIFVLDRKKRKKSCSW